MKNPIFENHRIAVCQQPNYFPWLGYLEQCARAEKLIILDSVQWIRRGLQHRAKIIPHRQNEEGEARPDFQWLTVPTKSHGHRERPLKELILDPDDAWASRHWLTLASVYGKRPLFRSQFEPLLKPWFDHATQFKTLREATVSSMQLCFEALDIKPKIHMSSDLAEQGVKTERLISLCQSVNADVYYSGLASSSYLDTHAFRDANIRLVWQRWKCSEYDQGRESFRSHLSILDVLANVPIAEIKDWLSIKPWGPFGDLKSCVTQ